MNDLTKSAHGLQGLSPNHPLFTLLSFPGAGEGSGFFRVRLRVARYERAHICPPGGDPLPCSRRPGMSSSLMLGTWCRKQAHAMRKRWLASAIHAASVPGAPRVPDSVHARDSRGPWPPARLDIIAAKRAAVCALNSASYGCVMEIPLVRSIVAQSPFRTICEINLTPYHCFAEFVP
jgi:hypothetical protein